MITHPTFMENYLLCFGHFNSKLGGNLQWLVVLTIFTPDYGVNLFLAAERITNIEKFMNEYQILDESLNSGEYQKDSSNIVQ